ncbi:protein mono-ADP-ribosyltransferase PARP9 [Mastacembelus armatus]|uniref:protein mono-ADP-ribosyltransferase PARP9 n=1 Tax=Mastacembelus armatus TaxID=205130 RepID=UPI000E45B5A1|nr:protein mono-ADP-ribosyltransferase PARP9-like [Mastacembelus armatus]
MMASTIAIPLHESSLHIVKQCGPILNNALQSKFGSLATFDGVNFEKDHGIALLKKPVVAPEKRFSVKLYQGVNLSVWKADLTNFPVDAVVNAANEHLQHYGGLADALSSAGGPQIQKDCNDYITKNGSLRTGDAIVCDAGLLPCKKIIHAVGPKLPLHPSASDVSSAEWYLKKAISNILDEVRKNQLKTVAIPAISSGLFNYPLPQCADTIVSTVKQYYQHPPHRYFPDEIFLVNHDEPTVKEMERACHQILGNVLPKMYSQAAGSNSTGGGMTSQSPLKIGNVVLTLKKGKIEEQQTDVIVNTTSAELKLDSGTVSKALLMKAGFEMQKEIKSAARKNYVIHTKPYNLKCKAVYHTWITRNSTVKEDLYKSVSECLWLAATKYHTSIAFPAIGTGGLGLNKKEVAQIMSQAVANFAGNFQNKMEVYFVIFPSDRDTFKAFDEEMRSLQLKASEHDFTHAHEHKDDLRDLAKISLSGPSDEATSEAEYWLSCLFSKSSGTSFQIYNNFIQHFGEKEYEQLSQLTNWGINVKESLVNGHASILVNGGSYEEAVIAGLQVEAILRDVQQEFIKEQERAMLEMLPLPPKRLSSERKAFEISASVSATFGRAGLQVLRVEKVENSALSKLFDLKKEQLQISTPKTMFQLIPAQFCEMISHIGFQAECAPPRVAAYGQGIYFTGSVSEAMEVWKKPNEKYLYFVEADVLSGDSTPGKPGLILPPARARDSQKLYDSVSGGRDVAVIFSGYQALPKHIITCKMI